MLSSALSLFLLRELPFDRFAFPRWQSVLAITMIGILAGLDPGLTAGTSEMPGLPLWLAIPFSVLIVWAAFLVILAVLKWWMKRGGRWDGQGDLFNLLAASWLVADALGTGVTALGAPPLLTLPLWLYSVWVGANALSGAIPKVSLGYAIGGSVVGLIPAMLVTGILFAVLGIALAMLGFVPAGAGAGVVGLPG